ncbi:hypothetical protein LMG27952_05396 [Paraburkholderia hiiakae]|uniref:Uncharacterized protein n=1 Tax=Paraburkholderia hiiakae TaxID=1081782 RepID=A0ABN7I8F3_9BURK|nr:hypothetical protein [Paraburkholderia hiiakae]CAD6553167.1 hypothetical protein LMG27952_05396 [Paraburkholderia hiiakae]
MASWQRGDLLAECVLWIAVRVVFVTGFVFAALFEAFACFAWLLALRPAVVIEIALTPAIQGAAAQLAMTAAAQPGSMLQLPVVQQADDVKRVTAAAAGTLRATLTETRKFLGYLRRVLRVFAGSLTPQPLNRCTRRWQFTLAMKCATTCLGQPEYDLSRC